MLLREYSVTNLMFYFPRQSSGSTHSTLCAQLYETNVNKIQMIHKILNQEELNERAHRHATATKPLNPQH